MSSQIRYKMHGFNVSPRGSSSSSFVTLKNNSKYYYGKHDILESVFIDDKFSTLTFTLLPGKEAKDHLDEISDELEKICFNIIAYSGIPTVQPVCSIEMITNELGTKIELSERLSFRDSIEIRSEMEMSVFYENIMRKNTPLSDNKATYKELFFILHNPHEVIQFIALYDILLNLICRPDERNKQKRVRDFLGKNRNKYPFIQFHQCNDNSDKKEDTFSHLRNNIAHSKSAGIEEFQKTSESITYREISYILQVINDIISGETKVE